MRLDLFAAAAVAGFLLLGIQRSFQSTAYDTALRKLDSRVSALEGQRGNAQRSQIGSQFSQELFREDQQTQSKSEPASDRSSAASNKGGRKVFIDLGANCGNSYLKLKRKKVLEGKWEVYLWEANPQMVKFYLTDLASKDPDVQIVPLAAWTENKKMKFYLTKGQENVTDIKQFKAHKCNPRSIHQPAGASSLFSGAGMGDDKRRKNAHKPGSEVIVDAVDFAAWLSDLKLTPSDHVILKIDIEGAELPLLKKFLKSAPLPCLVDIFYVEWHSWMIADLKERAETEAFETGFLDAVAAVCGGKKPTFGAWH